MATILATSIAPPLVLAIALALGGCGVGPDFQRPLPPGVQHYTQQPITATVATPSVQAGQAQRFAVGTDLPADWWTLFRCPALDALIQRALTASPDLASAQAALRVAQENTLAQRGAYFPSVNAQLAGNRNRTSKQISPTPDSGAFYYSLYTPQVSVSYAPDVFGLNRRNVESLQAQQDQARYALAATQVTLTSNIVAAAIGEASLRAQVAASQELVRIDENLLRIVRAQFGKGYASRADVAAQQAQLAQTQATLPPLRKQLAQQRDLLAALAGGYAGDPLPETFTLSDLHLPTELPLSLPSRLTEQRPDVRQAEANLHAASAQIGVAMANRLPNITLTADAGTMALQLGKLLSSSASFWTLGAGIAAPLFDGGTLKHRELAARATYDEAAAQYRGTVIGAFQNVADTLAALQQDADALKAAAAASDAAQVSLDIAQKQARAGYASNIALLAAQQTCQQAQLNLVQAQANRYADTAALFQALGGGWWHDSAADAPR